MAGAARKIPPPDKGAGRDQKFSAGYHMDTKISQTATKCFRLVYKQFPHCCERRSLLDNGGAPQTHLKRSERRKTIGKMGEVISLHELFAPSCSTFILLCEAAGGFLACRRSGRASPFRTIPEHSSTSVPSSAGAAVPRTRQIEKKRPPRDVPRQPPRLCLVAGFRCRPDTTAHTTSQRRVVVTSPSCIVQCFLRFAMTISAVNATANAPVKIQRDILILLYIRKHKSATN